MCLNYVWCIFLVPSSIRKPFWFFIYFNICCVGEEKTTLMSLSDGLDPFIHLSKDGKDLVYEGRDGRRSVFSRQSWHFSFIDNMIKVLFPICTLNCRVNIFVSRQRKGINRRTESTNIIIQFCSFWYHTLFLKSLTVCSRWNFSLIRIGDVRLCYKIKTSIQSSQLTELFPQFHGICGE